jgi:hypothetical protein
VGRLPPDTRDQLCLAQFMVIVDVTVVNVAPPVIADQFGLDRTG